MKLNRAIIALILAVFIGAFLAFRSAAPEEESGTFATRPVTRYSRFRPAGPPLGTVLVVHGLNANKELMRPLSMALADGGFEVYAIDLPGHGDSGAAFSVAESVAVVGQVLDILDPDTATIGHSMGGGVLLEVAASRAIPTMVLYSPAPVPVEAIQAGRLLVISGQLETPAIRAFASRLVDAAGPHAFQWHYPSATHSSALFRPARLRALVRWMGGRWRSVRSGERLAELALMGLAGLALGLALPIRHSTPRPPHEVEGLSAIRMLVEYIGAAFIAAVLLGIVVPLGWMGLFATDYLLSFLLVTGLLLWPRRALTLSRRDLRIAVLGAAYLIGLVVMVGGEFVHTVPAGTQWYRVPLVAVIAFPLCLRDETMVRPLPGRWKRWSTFTLSRIVLWAGVVNGVLLLETDAGFLVLIMHLLVAFWIALWWLTGYIARRTDGPAAPALFAAVVQAWVFAALFVRA